METRAHYVAVGAFVLAMITLAFVAVLWLARAQLTTQYAKYDIYFKGPVTGLIKGATVDYSGVPVGKVAEIKINPDKRDSDRQIKVTVEIDSSIVEIKEEASAAIETNLLSGVSFIQIDGGNLNAPKLTAKGDEPYPVIQPRRSDVGKVIEGAPELVKKAGRALDRFNQLLGDDNLQAVGATLDNVKSISGDVKLVSGALAERSKELGEVISNANAAMSDAKTMIENIDSGEAGLGKRLATAIDDVDRVAKNLTETTRQLQLAVQDSRPGVRTFSQQTLSDVGSLVGEVRQLISGLSRLTSEIERDPTRVLFGDRREGYRPR